MTEPVLETRGLCKRFGGLTATEDVSLTLRPGEIHALIGPNGAGKTTLIAQIAGALAPDAGRVLLRGQDVTPLSVAARARRGLGRSFQIPCLAPELSARRNVMLCVQGRAGGAFGFVRPVRSNPALTGPAEAALTRVGLAAKARMRVSDLSHGERRLVEVACALALAPRALLLDEPMAGLGADGTAELTRTLAALRDEAPILLVEHDMDAVFRLADRVSVLVAGRIVASGPPDAIRADAAVREAYLGDG